MSFSDIGEEIAELFEEASSLYYDREFPQALAEMPREAFTVRRGGSRREASPSSASARSRARKRRIDAELRAARLARGRDPFALPCKSSEWYAWAKINIPLVRDSQRWAVAK